MNKTNWPQDVVERFWSKVKYPGNDQDCWEWTANKLKKGYGFFWMSGFGKLYIHRLSWEFFNGYIPTGLLVCHKCDNPSCCNPDHLFLGTYDDNNKDAKQKGRNTIGSRHGGSILTDEQVKEMLNRIWSGELLSVKHITEIYKISRIPIINILNGNAWTHITSQLNQNISLSDIKRKIIHDKFTIQQVKQIKQLLKNGISQHAIAKQFNTSVTAIWCIDNGKTWKHVTI